LMLARLLDAAATPALLRAHCDVVPRQPREAEYGANA
jgi:hypothetical protein